VESGKKVIVSVEPYLWKINAGQAFCRTYRGRSKILQITPTKNRTFQWWVSGREAPFPYEEAESAAEIATSRSQNAQRSIEGISSELTDNIKSAVREAEEVER
jgi:hypothetical protein